VSICAFIAQVEYSELVIFKRGVSFSRSLLVAACLTVTTASLFEDLTIALILGPLLVVLFSYFLIYARNADTLEDIRDTIGISALGLLYVGVLPAFVMGVIQSEHGDTWFFTLLAIVFFGDTFAYFIGRATGKTKIWPLISPNKTWEGAIGGLFGSVLGAILMKFLFLYEVPALAMVLLAVFAGAAAQIGDFFESLLKRVANKKDSGSLMPGHGGILDRIDGVLFAAPFVYVASRVFLKIF
jgi:phosphatidate cytidylyltransferase